MVHRSHVDGRSTVARPFRLNAEARAAASINNLDLGTVGLAQAGQLPISGRPAAVGARLIAGLLGTAAWFAIPGQATAQASCSVQNNVYTCTVPGGNSPVYVNPTAPIVLDAGQSMAVTSLGNTNITSSSNLGP
ncbi:hypothetical protein AB4144_52075, partial [Rhizobiaceae sp. 2RAB30]